MSSTSPTLPSILDRDPASLTSDECLDAPLESPMALVQRGLEGNLKETADIAAATGLLATQALAKRVVMDAETMTTKQLIDVAEHSAKLSGLLKRQGDNQDQNRFVFNILYRGGEVETIADKAVEAVAADPLVNFRAAIDFSSAPEFCSD